MPFGSGWISCFGYELGRMIEPKAQGDAPPPEMKAKRSRRRKGAYWRGYPPCAESVVPRRKLTGLRPTGLTLLAIS